jgi:hypothetical protein
MQINAKKQTLPRFALCEEFELLTAGSGFDLLILAFVF